MKKIYTIIMLLAPFVYNANAQSRLAVPTPVPVAAAIKGGNPSTLTLDTLKPPVMTMLCFTSDVNHYVWYNLGTAGFLAGTNSYGETECAQRYAYSGSGTISQVLVWYGHKAGSAGTTSAKVYAVDATTKKPTSVMGTSSAITIANLAATGYTCYTFSPAVTVTTNFAVSAVLPTTAGDSVVVVSSKEGCSSDSMSYLNIAQFGGWNTIGGLINRAGLRDTSMDLMIRPVVTIASGMNEYPSSNGLTLMGAYPNPAQDFTNIRYNTIVPAIVSVEVFDLTGRIIEKSSETLAAGTHDMKVSLKGIAPGNYYYTVNTGSAQLTSKFVVTK